MIKLTAIADAKRASPADVARLIAKHEAALHKPPRWGWPDCRHRPACNAERGVSNGKYRCGFLGGGPPLHCKRYEPVEGTRESVAASLNAVLAAKGKSVRLAA